jgi:hypothetical protein
LGAIGDGRTDDTTALATAASSPLFLPPGAYRLTRDVTFAAPVVFAFGAVLKIDPGVTISFVAGLSAGVCRIFEAASGARVRIDPRFTSDGFPEWWGAHADDPQADCQPAIQACLEACVRTRLHAADYYIASTVKITDHGRQLEGLSADQEGNRHGTRLVLTSGAADGLQVGYDRQPPTAKQWLEHVAVRDLTVLRAAPLENPEQGFATAPAGVRLQWAVTCYLERVETIEHSHGFYITGTVHCYLRYCQAFRFKAGALPANDFFHGFFMDNSPSTGFNSGNASLYIQNCSTFSTQAIPFSESNGLKSNAGFTDTFITGFECALVEYGLNLSGRTSAGSDYQSEDLIIDTCVLDSPTRAGIRIERAGQVTAVQIHNSYIAPAGPGVAIEIRDCHGAVGITGCQIIATPDNVATGLHVVDSAGVSAMNNIYTDIHSPVVFERASDCRLVDTINSPQRSPAKAAVQATALDTAYLAAIVRGRPGSVPAGVALLGAANKRVEVACTGIRPSVLAAGVASVLVCDDTPITKAGPFGAGNLASGIVG